MTKFYVQDESIFIPTSNLAQSFAVLNFIQENSLGLGTDTLVPAVNPDNPNFIADIKTKDLWGFTSGGNIYRMTRVGIQNNNPSATLDVTGTLHITGATNLDSTLDVIGATTLKSTLDVTGATTLKSTLDVSGATTLKSTLDVSGATTLKSTLDVTGETKLHSKLTVDDDTLLKQKLNVNGDTSLDSKLDVDGDVTFNSTTQSSDKDSGALITQGGVGIEKNLNVGGNTKLVGTLELDSSIIDINNSTALGKFDYRLSSVGTGVSWRPPGVQTQKTVWVTLDGNDSNSGLLEGDAKRSIGAAAAIAKENDTIFVRPGIYVENNPIGLRDDVCVSGQDLRLVTVIPQNLGKDVFHVRRGCLIENLNFACNTGQSNPGGGAVAFPPTTADISSGKSYAAVTGYTSPGPATEGSSGRWRSPYIRNCTNFMPLSIGMKINGDHATASTIGADLKCMVCDSFTQYNEAGIGVSITNNGYAQLVSIFTINCDKAIYCDTGGQCDLTNSNSSFGNYGLYAVGLGATEFTGKVKEYTSSQNANGRLNDKVTLTSVFAVGTNAPRRPYDGQALWFKINLNNYPDAVGTGIITAPMRRLSSITVKNSASTYSASSPPSITIQDNNDGTILPKGPQGIIAEASANIDDTTNKIVSIDVINSGRNYLSSQDIRVVINGEVQETSNYVANMEPIYFTVLESTDNRTLPSGTTITTFNEFIPYELFVDDEVEFKRISRILTSSHSFEYIGTGTDINISTPQKGGVPAKANEIVALDGAQIPFTSTDQKGNFDIGEGLRIDQTTSTISGRAFSRAIQAEITPLILALR
jgi:cytoskeletal protein CcmA (bactofilin family)